MLKFPTFNFQFPTFKDSASHKVGKQNFQGRSVYVSNMGNTKKNSILKLQRSLQVKVVLHNILNLRRKEAGHQKSLNKIKQLQQMIQQQNLLQQLQILQ